MEFDVVHGASVVHELCHHLACSKVPNLRAEKKKNEKKLHDFLFLNSHLHGSFLASRGHPLSVGAELEAVDSFTMAFVGKNASFSSDIPQLEVCIP